MATETDIVTEFLKVSADTERRFMRRRRSIFLAVLIIVTLLAILAFSLAIRTTQQASYLETAAASSALQVRDLGTAQAESDRQRDLAEFQLLEIEKKDRKDRARRLASQAITDLDSWPQRSLLLAVEAISSTLGVDGGTVPVAEQALMEAVRATGGVLLTGGENPAENFTVSSNREWLAAANSDGSLEIWRLADSLVDPVVLSGFDVLSDFQREFDTLVCSPDGRWLAVGKYNNGYVYVWDVSNPANHPVALEGRQAGSIVLRFSSNSKWLASGGADRAVRIWGMDNLADGAVSLREYKDQILDLAFSPDDRWLAITTGDGQLEVRRTADPTTEPYISRVYSETIGVMAFSPNSRWFAAESEPTTVSVFDLTTPSAKPATCKSDGYPFSAIAFSPISSQLALGSWDGIVKLWDMERPQIEPSTLGRHQEAVVSIAFSIDGRWLATGSLDKTALLWDMTRLDEEPAALSAHESYVGVWFSSLGDWLFTAGTDGIRRWEVAHPQAQPVILQGHGITYAVVGFSPDGRWLASKSDDGTTELWTMSDLASDPLELRGPPGEMPFVVFSPDSRWLATGNWNQTAQLYDLSIPGGAPKVLSEHEEDLEALVFSPDGHWLATGSLDNTIRVWDMNSLGAEPIQLHGHEDYVTSLAFSPDSLLLASGGVDNTVRIWDVAHQFSESFILDDYGDLVADVAFSPGGQWLATASYDGTVQLWNVKARGKPIILRTFREEISEVAFSLNGRWLSANGLGSAWLWDVTTPVFPSEAAWSYEDDYSRTAFSRDGHWAVTMPFWPSSSTAQLWNLGNSQSEAIQLRGYKGGFRDAAFSPDGCWLAMAGEGSPVLVWRLCLEDLLAMACTTAGRNLTEQEWRLFMGDEPYRKTCLEQPIHPSFIESGRELVRTGNMEGAIEVFERALDLEPVLNLDPAEEANRVAAQVLVEGSIAAARTGDIDSAMTKLRSALELHSELDTLRAAANGLVEASERLAVEGRIEDAFALLEEAQRIDPSMETSADFSNSICWYGSLWGYAGDVIDDCEEAVRLAPRSGNIRDSRGLARAITGNYAGAIEDFEFFLESFDGQEASEANIAKRWAWIATLKRGSNPFDQSTLEALRQGE